MLITVSMAIYNYKAGVHRRKTTCII